MCAAASGWQPARSGRQASAGELRVEVAPGALDHVTLHVRGDLSLRTAPTLRRALTKALIDRGRVVADVSRLVLVDDLAVLVLPAAYARADGWPAAKFGLSGASPRLVDALDRYASGRIPCHGTLAQATARLDDRPVRVRRELRLEPTVSAAGQARAFVTETCQAWGVGDELVEIAQVATSELATNATEHARTPFTVSLELHGLALHIGVRDQSTAVPVLQPVDLTCPRGRGIALVDGLASAWGVHTHAGGKTVWLVITPAHHRNSDGKGDRDSRGDDASGDGGGSPLG